MHPRAFFETATRPKYQAPFLSLKIRQVANALSLLLFKVKKHE